MWYRVFESLWFMVAYPVTLLLAVLVGYWFAEVYYRRRNRIWKPSGIESALITIYGLLLSFTLLSSNNALKERTTLIHQSSEAIIELYRESQLLPAATHATVRTFLLSLLTLELGEHGADPGHDPTHAHKISVLGQQSWQQLRDSIGQSSSHSDDLRRLLPAFTKLNATTSRLHYSYQERTPHPIIALLLVSSWAIGILVGFTNSAQEMRHYFVPLLFIGISVLTVQAISDLDNPKLGFIRPNYDNLLDLQRMLLLDQLPPAKP